MPTGGARVNRKNADTTQPQQRSAGNFELQHAIRCCGNSEKIKTLRCETHFFMPRKIQLGLIQQSFFSWDCSSGKISSMPLVTPFTVSNCARISGKGQKSCHIIKPPERKTRKDLRLSLMTTSG